MGRLGQRRADRVFFRVRFDPLRSGRLHAAARGKGPLRCARTAGQGPGPDGGKGQPPQPEDGRNAVVRANVYGVPRDIHAKIEERFDLVLREAFGMTEVGSAMFMPIELSPGDDV